MSQGVQTVIKIAQDGKWWVPIAVVALPLLWKLIADWRKNK